MRFNRLLEIIMMLQTQGQITAGELATRLDVSERTILRDMESLSVAGIPVISERGRNGGWSLIEGYRNSLTGLQLDEIQALMLANPPRILEDLGLENAAEQAILKILSTLPSIRQEEAERWRQYIHIDGTRWQGKDEDTACLPLLQDAIWKQCRIVVDYVRGDNEAVSRELEPLGLVAKGRIWYLIAQADGDFRTYRVSRIQSATLTTNFFARPKDFDLADYWEESTQAFVEQLPKLPAILKVHSDAIRHIQSWRWATIQTITPTDDTEWQIVHVMFEVIEEATACVLGCGGLAQVIKPELLRKSVSKKIGELYLSELSSTDMK